MTEFSCTYGDNRDEALVALLYDDREWSAAERDRFEAHVAACARCRGDLAELRGVRSQLAHWSPPEPIHLSISNQQSAISNQHWWRQVPVWAQVAAALLFLGVSAAIANLDVRYDHNGLSVRTGWSSRAGGSDGAGRAGEVAGSAVAQGFSPANTSAPWKADIAALESQLKREIRTVQSAAPAPAPAVRVVPAADTDGRVRALLAESEKRQQRELALRIAELMRDVNAQRQADMVKIDRTLGVVQNNVGIEVMKTRQQMNQMDLIYRASQRQ